MQIGKEAESRREALLVDTIVTNTAKGRGGSIGLEDTLSAIREGRVQSLVIRDGYRAPGFRCKSCGHLSSMPMGNCPFCDGETEQIPDAVEVAVGQVMRSGGEVEVLHGNQTGKGFEQIGALRRIHASIVVEKEGHKPIVIGAGGETLKRMASAARLDMQRLFGGKVHLEVWVKVRGGWTNDARAVKTLGYE